MTGQVGRVGQVGQVGYLSFVVFVVFVVLVSSWPAGLHAVQLVSVADEITIGRQTQAETRKNTPEVGDSSVRAYVMKIGTRLGERARGERYPYSFSVADYKEINAFALPGGPVWVNRGAIQAAGSESQLAGILAHEVAHVSQRHAAQQLSNMMVTNMGMTLFSALLGNTGAAMAANIAARYVAGETFLKFSLDDEDEADRVGAEIMARAGWDSHGMIDLLETVREQEKRDPSSVEVFFSNHPAPKDRIALLAGVVPAKRAGKRDSAEFQSIRARLRKLPPAGSMTKKK
jgi:predicted Zn-dependent protease